MSDDYIPEHLWGDADILRRDQFRAWWRRQRIGLLADMRSAGGSWGARARLRSLGYPFHQANCMPTYPHERAHPELARKQSDALLQAVFDAGEETESVRALRDVGVHLACLAEEVDRLRRQRRRLRRDVTRLQGLLRAGPNLRLRLQWFAQQERDSPRCVNPPPATPPGTCTTLPHPVLLCDESPRWT